MYTYKPLFGKPIGPWFRIFAWMPVNTIDGGWRWLRYVYRRRCTEEPYWPGLYWQYRLKTEVTVSIEDVFKVIDTEEEFPGDMPEELRAKMATMNYADQLRAVVIATKASIRKRIMKLAGDSK